jgi:hypothetical protein
MGVLVHVCVVEKVGWVHGRVLARGRERCVGGIGVRVRVERDIVLAHSPLWAKGGVAGVRVVVGCTCWGGAVECWEGRVDASECG